MYWGVWNAVFSLVGVVVFSVSLLYSENLSFFWLFLELVVLCLIPGFFARYTSTVLCALLIYIVVGSLSSSFMLMGILDPSLVFFFVLGFLVKFAVFPFFSWVYNVVLSCSSWVIWLLSTFFKVPFSFICLVFCGLVAGFYSVVLFLCIVSFLFLAFFMWTYSFNWRSVWCHMMVSSSCVLVMASLSMSSGLLWCFFLGYFVWSTLTIFFLFVSGSFDFDLVFGFGGSFGLFFWFGFVFFLLTTPVSFSFFYKVLASFCVYSCGWLMMFAWVVYGLSEQFFLLKYLVSSFVTKVSFNWFCLV
nr:NADH dehydrogenase subunit 2 [Strigea falconis]